MEENDNFSGEPDVSQTLFCEDKEKNEQIRQLLNELLESEKNYVKDLNEICSDYLQPVAGSKIFHSLDRTSLKSSHRKSTPRTTQRQSELEFQSPSNAELSQIFCNIRDLKDYHERVFLPKLQESIYDKRKLRELFTSEHSKLTRKYGRYCINYNYANKIIKNYLNYFSFFQFENNLKLRIDGMLIKPVQRITRYQLFLNSLSKLFSELGLAEEYEEYSLASQSIISVAQHTNTMMWVGGIHNCPHDLSAQGQLLKYGPVQTKSLSRAGSLSTEEVRPDSDQQKSPLTFVFSLSVNQVRVRDTVEENENMFEIHRLENMKILSDGKLKEPGQIVSKIRILCESQQTKNSWVSTINTEIKQLKSLARSLAFD